VKHSLIYNCFECNKEVSHYIFSDYKLKRKLFCGSVSIVSDYGLAAFVALYSDPPDFELETIHQEPIKPMLDLIRKTGIFDGI
jgi:hypothetical protein